MTSAKTVEQGNKPHYAWLVMIAYGLMMSGTIGSFSVVGAQWFYPVSTDIGCELSTLTLYTTIEMVCMGLAMPLVGNLLTRVKLPVILIAAVAMEVLALWPWPSTMSLDVVCLRCVRRSRAGGHQHRYRHAHHG